MSRITIEQAISHAREVAEKNRANCKRNTIIIPNRWISDTQCAEEHEQLAGWLEELQRYKDLKEQGRLMELPCAEGDTVYLISSQYSECSKYQERFNDYNCQGCENECDSHKEYFIHVNENMSAEWIVRAMRLNRFGEDVFLTKEEAEAKLAEMEGAE